MEWQPIKTVPTNGTKVLLFTKSGILEAHYSKYRGRDKWFCDAVTSYEDIWLEDDPTHWMPLPNPPPP